MIKDRKKKARSPLKDKPLRNPGQSLDEELDLIRSDKFVGWFMISAMCIILTCLEWWRWYMEIPPAPITMTIVSAVIVAFAAFRVVALAKQYRRIKLGRDGEKAVGQYLERLRENGARVFHDIVGDGFNVDHVVVASQGIFVIETKTLSKPTGKDARVV